MKLEAKDTIIDVDVPGWSIRGAERRLVLTRGQPGRIALTTYVKDKPAATVIVSANQLRQAVNRVS